MTNRHRRFPEEDDHDTEEIENIRRRTDCTEVLTENAPQLSPGKLLALTVMAQQNPELPINEKNVRDNVRQLESQPGYQEQINFFLSTMSHDNRRPMNAIIGLMSITENDVYKGVGTRVNQKPASHWQI